MEYPDYVSPGLVCLGREILRLRSDPLKPLPERKKGPQEYHVQYSQGSLVIPYYFLFISAVLRGAIERRWG